WHQMFRAKQGVDVPDHRTAHAEELEAVLKDGKSERGKELGDPREVAEQLLRWSEIKEKRRDVGGSEFGGAEACRGPEVRTPPDLVALDDLCRRSEPRLTPSVRKFRMGWNEVQFCLSEPGVHEKRFVGTGPIEAHREFGRFAVPNERLVEHRRLWITERNGREVVLPSAPGPVGGRDVDPEDQGDLDESMRLSHGAPDVASRVAVVMLSQYASKRQERRRPVRSRCGLRTGAPHERPYGCERRAWPGCARHGAGRCGR